MKYCGMPRPKAKAKEPSLDTGNDINRISRVDKTYQELIEQSDVFGKTLAYTKENMACFISSLRDRTINRVLFIGCGDSWFVGTTLELLVENLLGCPCQSFDAYEFCLFHSHLVDEKSLVIGQSASGTTSAVIEALKRARIKGAFTVGVSNTEGAEILEEFDYGLMIQAKREGWPTQATTSAIGALSLLFANLAKTKGKNVELAKIILEELEFIPNKINETIKDNESLIKDKASLFKEDIFFQTASCGTLFGAAEVCSAKLRELCPVHASYHQLEEFHHYRTLKPNDPLILFTQDGDVGKKELDTVLVGAYDGGKIIVIGTNLQKEMVNVTDLFCQIPFCSIYLQPILCMVVSHLLAYYIAKVKYDFGIGYPSESENG